MVLTFWKEQNELARIFIPRGNLTIDRYDHLLANQVGYKVLLGRIDGSGLPKDADFRKERVDDVEHRSFKAIAECIYRNDFFKTGLIQLDHCQGKGADLVFIFTGILGQGTHTVVDFLSGHLSDAGNLITIAIEQGNIQQQTEVLLVVITDVGPGALRLQDRIAGLPYPQGVGFDSR